MNTLRTLPRALPKLPTTILFRTRPFSTTLAHPYARLTLIGRLGATPEQIVTSNGRHVIRYAVAHDSGPSDRREVSWFKVSMPPPRGETGGEGTAFERLMLSLPKGTLMHVEADSKLRTYDDPNTGGKRTVLDLLQRSVEVLQRPKPQLEGAAEDDEPTMSAEEATREE